MQDAKTFSVRWNRRDFFTEGVFALVLLPAQGVAVAASWANKIVALRLSDGEPIGASLPLRTRHLTVDRGTGKVYCPQQGSIFVIEWQGDPTLPGYGLAVIDKMNFVDTVQISSENSVLGFVPRAGGRPAHLVTGRWGNAQLCVIDLEARTVSHVDGTALAGGAEGTLTDVTGLAVDGPGCGVLVINLRDASERRVHVLPLPLPLTRMA